MKKFLTACAAVAVTVPLWLSLSVHTARAAPVREMSVSAPVTVAALDARTTVAGSPQPPDLPLFWDVFLKAALLAFFGEEYLTYYLGSEFFSDDIVASFVNDYTSKHAGDFISLFRGMVANLKALGDPQSNVNDYPLPPRPVCDNWYSTFYCDDGPPSLPTTVLLHNSLTSSEKVTYGGETDSATGLPVYYGPPGTGADGCASYSWGKPRTISSLAFGKMYEVKEVVCTLYYKPPTQQQLNSCPKGQHYYQGDCLPGSVPVPVVTTVKPKPVPKPVVTTVKPKPVPVVTTPAAGTDYLGDIFGGGKLNNCNFASGYLVGNCNPYGETEAQYIADPGGPVPAPVPVPSATPASGCLPGADPGTCTGGNK